MHGTLQEAGCQPSGDPSRTVKRRRLRRHDMQVSQSMAGICKKEESLEAGLGLRNLWLKTKLSCSVAPFFPLFLVAAPLKMIFPTKGSVFCQSH